MAHSLLPAHGIFSVITEQPLVFCDGVSENFRLSCPTGYSRVKILWQVQFDSKAGSDGLL